MKSSLKLKAASFFLHYSLICFIIIWSLIQLFIYLKFGTVTILESKKYIQAAEYFLANGTFPEKRYLFYSGITLLIAFCKYVGLGYSEVIFFQLIYSLLAHVLFLKALRKLSPSTIIPPFVTVCCLSLYIPFQFWNFTLYSESLFYSSTLAFFSCCLLNKPTHLTGLLSQLTFLLIAVFCRPLGALLIPCWTLYLIITSTGTIKYILISLLFGSLFILILLSNYILSSIGDWQILKPAEYGYVICDMPSSDSISLEISKDITPLRQLRIYISEHPGHFFKMCYKKTIAFFFLYRPYYSTLHNLFLLIMAIVTYLPIMLTLRKSADEDTHLKKFSYSIILIFWLSVCLQCDDYHNRFYNSTLPFFLYLGVFLFLKKKMSSIPSKKTEAI
jgi:hypothetical protein